MSTPQEAGRLDFRWSAWQAGAGSVLELRSKGLHSQLEIFNLENAMAKSAALEISVHVDSICHWCPACGGVYLVLERIPGRIFPSGVLASGATIVAFQTDLSWTVLNGRGNIEYTQVSSVLLDSFRVFPYVLHFPGPLHVGMLRVTDVLLFCDIF